MYKPLLVAADRSKSARRDLSLTWRSESVEDSDDQETHKILA